jgi:hypothetical protein
MLVELAPIGASFTHAQAASSAAASSRTPSRMSTILESDDPMFCLSALLISQAAARSRRSRRHLCRQARDGRGAKRPYGLARLSRRASAIARRSARSLDSVRRFGPVLRRSGADLRLRGRNHEKPRQSRQKPSRLKEKVTGWSNISLWRQRRRIAISLLLWMVLSA